MDHLPSVEGPIGRYMPEPEAQVWDVRPRGGVSAGEDPVELVDKPESDDLAHVVLEVEEELGEPPRVVARV
jgi:hypothetical protein